MVRGLGESGNGFMWHQLKKTLIHMPRNMNALHGSAGSQTPSHPCGSLLNLWEAFCGQITTVVLQSGTAEKFNDEPFWTKR